MRLNKNASFALIHLLGGADSAAAVAGKMPAATLRSVQRALVRLNQLGLVDRHGVNDPRYALNYEQILQQPANPALLENVDRPNSSFNFQLLDWLAKNPDLNLSPLLGAGPKTAAKPTPMTARELEHLTIELSWKSSALEGNSYSLLDTQLLLTDGVKAKNKTSFETQMVLNHQEAMGFISKNPKAFRGEIRFAAVEELHRHISHNLGIEPGIRRRLVRISASNYQPPATPHKIRESADQILSIISRQTDPAVKALLAWGLMPYLQPFEDGNKRVGRLLANAILIHSIGRGVSLRGTDAKELALAHLSFYEFNSLAGLTKILNRELAV